MLCAMLLITLVDLVSTNSSVNVARHLHSTDYLGTSSNWAFTRRVLNMAYERHTGQPAPAQNMVFDGTMYDLGWDGQRDISNSDDPPLPSADHATYLINAVKFHCGQMFHLFDETSFMRKFAETYQTRPNATKPSGLWYVHFLLLLAFGTVFVARRNDGRKPRGADYFVQAMKLMPDITFLHTQPIEAVEVLCCQALYLQCLDFRSSACSVVRFQIIAFVNLLRSLDWPSFANSACRRIAYKHGARRLATRICPTLSACVVDNLYP